MAAAAVAVVLAAGPSLTGRGERVTTAAAPMPTRSTIPAPSSLAPLHGESGSTTTPTTRAAGSGTPSRTPSDSPSPSPSTTSATAPPSTRTPTTTTPSSTAVTSPVTSPATSSSWAREVLRLTNVERGEAGCPDLTWNDTLAEVAQEHSEDMRDNGYFSHTGQDGRSPFQRMMDAGYSYRAAAENIAAGQRSPAAVTTAWMNSAGHRANILNCSLTELGVGVARGGSYGVYWTQDFGTPA